MVTGAERHDAMYVNTVNQLRFAGGRLTRRRVGPFDSRTRNSQRDRIVHDLPLSRPPRRVTP